MSVKMKSESSGQLRNKGLTRDRIVDAALSLVDQEGLASLSARRLAARLGCKPMSLYNHVRSMDDVEDGIVDRLLASIAHHSRSANDLAAASLSYLALADRHPEAFVLVATRVWRGPNALAAAGAIVAGFMDMGLSEDEALRRARILGAYLNGSGLALGAWRKREQKSGLPEGGSRVTEDLNEGLVQLVAMLSDIPRKEKAAAP